MGKGYEETVQKRSNSNVNKHVKKSLTSLVIRQIQKKVTIGFMSTTRLIKIQKGGNSYHG